MSHGARFPQTQEETFNMRLAQPISQLLKADHEVGCVLFNYLPAIFMTLRISLFRKIGSI